VQAVSFYLNSCKHEKNIPLQLGYSLSSGKNVMEAMLLYKELDYQGDKLCKIVLLPRLQLLGRTKTLRGQKSIVTWPRNSMAAGKIIQNSTKHSTIP